MRRTSSRGGQFRFALLAGLCIAAVLVSLYANHRQGRVSDEILARHQTWSDRMARYGRMGQLSLAISAPCNEVFDSGNLAAERARSRLARVAFAAQMDSARLELADLRRDISGPVLKDLKAVKALVDAMVIDVDRTFASFGVGAPPDVVVIDGHVARIHEALQRLHRDALEAQGREAQTVLASSTVLQRTFATILLWASLIVIAIVLVRRLMSPSAVATLEEPEPEGATQEFELPPVPMPAPDFEGAEPEPMLAVREPEPMLAALQESVTRMRLVLDAAPDSVITMDENGWITEWNAHAERMFGRSSEQMQGLPFTESVIAARHREAIDQGLMRFLQTGVAEIISRRLEITAVDNEGQEFPIELAIVPSRSGESTVFTAFVRDITERTRANAQLRRLSLVANKTASGVLITDARGRTEWCNDAFVRISGYSLDDLHRRTPDAVFRGPRTEALALGRMTESFRTGTGFRVELDSVTRDGRPYWVDVEATPVLDDAGTVTQFIVVVTDISERKRSHTALRESEARTRAIVDGVMDAIVTTDDLGAITSVNPAAERIFQYRSEELIGKHICVLMPSLGDGAMGQAPKGDVKVTSQSVAGGDWGVRRNGTAFPIELSINDVRLEGGKAWACIVRDVTQRKQAEALRAGEHRVLELLAAGEPLSGTLTELIRVIEEQQPGIYCMIMTLRPDPSRLRIVAPSNLPDDLTHAVESVELGPSACSWATAAHLKQRVIVDDTAMHPLWADFRKLALDFGLRSSWAEPIVSPTGHLLGVVVAFRRRVHTPSPAELELLAFAAHLAGIAIERPRATDVQQAYTLVE